MIDALAEELESAPRLVDKADVPRRRRSREAEDGQKGRALFHPIRLALTGAADGPELDLLVPAIDRGADLRRSRGIAPIVGARERARAFARRV